MKKNRNKLRNFLDIKVTNNKKSEIFQNRKKRKGKIVKLDYEFQTISRKKIQKLNLQEAIEIYSNWKK